MEIFKDQNGDYQFVNGAVGKTIPHSGKGAPKMMAPVFKDKLSTFAKNRALRNFISAPFHFSNVQTILRRPWIGSDPELFLQGEKGFVPAFKVLPSKKDSREIFWDGFQAEFTAIPSQCIQTHISWIQRRLVQLIEKARKTDKTIFPMQGDVVEISGPTFSETSEEYVALGCDPSMNAYGSMGSIPADPRMLPFRFAGGHIHFGCKDFQESDDPVMLAMRFARDLDKVLAIWSVGAAANYEHTKRRRQYYGLAGEFRLPDHGFEYRTLSNFWLLSDPCIAHLVFDMARAVFQATRLGVMKFWRADELVVRDVVNNYDVDMARKLLKTNEKLFKWLVSGANANYATFNASPTDCGKAAFKVAMEGIESVCDPSKFFDNWDIPGSLVDFTRDSFASHKTWRNQVNHIAL